MDGAIATKYNSGMTRASILPSDPDLYMIEERPTPGQQAQVDDYASRYRVVFSYPPFGLHYITIDEVQMPVWFPMTSTTTEIH